MYLWSIIQFIRIEPDVNYLQNCERNCADSKKISILNSQFKKKIIFAKKFFIKNIV